MPEQSFGKSLVSWETWEYPKHDRSLRWYIIAGIVGTALLLYAILTASFPFAVILLMIGIIIFLSHLHDPARVVVHVTTNGVLIGHHFYGYKEVENFSVVYNPPYSKVLYLDFVSRWHPLTSIPLEEVDPNILRESLMPYVIENLARDHETLNDVLARLLKI
ncbi:MAG: hypothetical protein AAB429_01015 [Patescibacteria group bacterium]